MIYKVRLNDDNQKIYNLVSWNAQSFSATLQLTVQGSDMSQIGGDFEHIEKLEVFQDEILLATYTNLDSYDEITFFRNEYVPGENRFSNALRLHLTKTDIIQQVQRLDEQMNPTVDLDAMTLDEVKEWKVKELGEICKEEIYDGEDVTLIDGSTKHFSYSAEDQANLTNSCVIAFASKTLGFPLEYIPYHPDRNSCQLMPVPDLLAIYMTLQLKLTRLTTKCNMLNCMIRECVNKEDILAINWDTQLLPEYQERYNEIVTASMEIAQAMAEAMQPQSNDDED